MFSAQIYALQISHLSTIPLANSNTNENVRSFVDNLCIILHRGYLSIMTNLKPVVPHFVVQEEGSRKVLVYLNIPELKVKRSFPNLLKQVPSNGNQSALEFRDQSFTFTLNVQTKDHQTKTYALGIARLPGDIEPDRCSIKYQRGGCWLTLVKAEPMPWMNRICDDLNPGLDIQENEDQAPAASAPVEPVQLRDTDMPPPFNLVPLAPSPLCRPPSTKSPAPPPPRASNT